MSAKMRVVVVLLLAAVFLVPPAQAAGRLEIREGDHICIIGGGVADAMQHTGWLETLLHSRFPEQRLVIRNLAYDGDEIDPEAAKLRRRPASGRPTHHSHGPTDGPERPKRYGDIEHLATGTAVHVAGPIHFPGLE